MTWGYDLDKEITTLDELLDKDVFDFVNRYYKEDLAEPLGLWLSILTENTTPYVDPKNTKLMKGDDGQLQENALPYVLDLQYAIGAKKLYEGLESAKNKLDEKIKDASNEDMKKSYKLQKRALDKVIGTYVEKTKRIGEFYAIKYKMSMEFTKNQIIEKIEEQKKKAVKPLDDNIVKADEILKSLN